MNEVWDFVVTLVNLKESVVKLLVTGVLIL